MFDQAGWLKWCQECHRAWFEACCAVNKAWVGIFFAMTDYPGARAKKEEEKKRNSV